MSGHSRAEVLRKYSMVSAFAVFATLGTVNAASMDSYNAALSEGNAKASAFEAMQLLQEQSLNGGASAAEVMKTAEQLMTGAVASGDEHVVKWVSAAILKGAGEENFNAAELGIRVVVDGSRYHAPVAQVIADAREATGIPAKPAETEAAVAASKGPSFLADLFDINRSSWKVSNRVSVGTDSNIYSNESEEDGMVYMDALNLSLSASSARTAAQVFYKPTLTVSPSKDVGENQVYQDFIGMLSHEVTERDILRAKDTYLLKEDQNLYSGTTPVDNSYWKNTAEVSWDRTIGSNSRLSLFANNSLKRYDNADQAEDKDYELYSVGTQYSKEFSDLTFAEGMLSYTDQDYDKNSDDKGSSTVLAYAGVNHQFNPDLILYGAAGAQFVTPDSSFAKDTVVPYANGKLTYYFSPRTSISAIAKYFYNQDETQYGVTGAESLMLQVAGRHSFTEKISLDLKVGQTVNTYKEDFQAVAVSAEKETTYTDYSARLTYKINRTHTIDAGYKYRDTDSDDYGYTRQQAELGWTINF